jgi:hypothetical protein
MEERRGRRGHRRCRRDRGRRRVRDRPSSGGGRRDQRRRRGRRPLAGTARARDLPQRDQDDQDHQLDGDDRQRDRSAGRPVEHPPRTRLFADVYGQLLPHSKQFTDGLFDPFSNAVFRRSPSSVRPGRTFTAICCPLLVSCVLPGCPNALAHVARGPLAGVGERPSIGARTDGGSGATLPPPAPHGRVRNSR